MNLGKTVIAVLLTVVPAAFGGTIYDNGGPSQITGYNFSKGNVADDFTLSSATSINSVTFWFFSTNGALPGQISYEIDSNNAAANTPGTVVNPQAAGMVNATAFATGLTINSNHYTEYEGTLNLANAVNLNPGTYWFSFHVGQANVSSSSNFYAETSNSVFGAPTSTYSFSTFTWTPGSATDAGMKNLAFSLAGSGGTNASPLPEPGTLFMLGAGLVALGAFSRSTIRRGSQPLV